MFKSVPRILSHKLVIPTVGVLLFIAGFATSPAQADFIDFETLPGGAATVDQQEISTQYAVFGVTFTLLARDTGLPIGSPRIAKAGPPRTAFEGCFAVDTPRPHLDLGESFLTDGTELGVEGDLLIEYATPVAQASGVILDIDCRTNGGPPCEQWTITAYDDMDGVIQTIVLDGPPGAPNPECTQPHAGPGDALAFGWVMTAGSEPISAIVLKYTGAATGVGLAFDNFSVAGTPDPPSVTVTSAAATVCAGETVELGAAVLGGIPPYAFRWQKETSPSSWLDLGSDSNQAVRPVVTSRYRLIITDTALSEATSPVMEITVDADDPLCTAGLLVSSHDNDRILRYSFRSRSPEVFVPTGSGGLNGPSKLICGPDGDLYVSSQANNRILRYDGVTGDFRDIFVAGGSGGLDIPIGLDFGPDGNLYVASYNTNSVLRYSDVDGTYIDAFVPVGSGLNGPTGLVFGPDDNLYVCSLNSNKVLRFDGTTGVPMGDFVTTGSGGLDAPRGPAFGPLGDLYIAEQYNDSVRRYDGTTGAFLGVFVSAGSGGLNRPNDVAFGLDDALYVAGYDNNKVLRFDGTGGGFLGELSDEFLNGPAWLTVGCQPLVSDVPDLVTSKLDVSVEPSVPNPFNPHTVVRFELSHAGPTRVTVIDLAGRKVATLLDRILTDGPHDVAWDGHGSDGHTAPAGVYFICVENGRARQAVKVALVR